MTYEAYSLDKIQYLEKQIIIVRNQYYIAKMYLKEHFFLLKYGNTDDQRYHLMFLYPTAWAYKSYSSGYFITQLCEDIICTSLNIFKNVYTS